jgi:hypothetical protein
MAKTQRSAGSTIHVGIEIARELEGLVRRLEERAAAEDKQHPIQSADLVLAANYLRLIFRPGHPLYRVPWVRKAPASAEAYPAESLVAFSVAQGGE